MKHLLNGVLAALLLAAQVLAVGVVDERDVAVVAALGVAALEAHHLGGESTPVEEENGLGAGVEGLPQRAFQGAGDDGALATRVLLALGHHVDDLDRGQRPLPDAVGEDESRELAPVGGEAHFE